MRERFLVIQRDQDGTRFRIVAVETSRLLANVAAHNCRGLVIEAQSFEQDEDRTDRESEGKE